MTVFVLLVLDMGQRDSEVPKSAARTYWLCTLLTV